MPTDEEVITRIREILNKLHYPYDLPDDFVMFNTAASCYITAGDIKEMKRLVGSPDPDGIIGWELSERAEIIRRQEQALDEVNGGVVWDLTEKCVSCSVIINDENRGGWIIENWPDGESGRLCKACSERIKPFSD